MSLEAFLNKFNSPDGKYVYSLDPLKYFTVTMKLNDESGAGYSGNNQTALQRGFNSVLNNATGGLFGKAMNSSKGTMKTSGYPNIGAVASDSLFEDGKNGVLDLTYFVQEATIPKISIPDSEVSETVIGSIKTHKMAVETDAKEFTLKILNTKVSILDRIFYPWMREISYPYWSYGTHPYTTATVTISFQSHNDVAYVFLGARPTSIESINATNALDTNMARGATFAFDFMYVSSLGKNVETIKDTIANTGRSIINKAASMINL